jgi:LacI family transcriptional regulator
MSLDEVAKRAQVSAATVSRVLNNVGQVRSSTAARVLKAAEELRYHPNLHARTLAGGKSRTLGMIVSNMENPFFIDIYKGAEQHARAKGFEVVLANTDYNPEYLVTDIRLMIGRRVAGLALVISEMEASLIEELSALEMPFVFYDVGSPKRNISHITVNYARGIEEIVDYLHQLGHRRMAFISHRALFAGCGMADCSQRRRLGGRSPRHPRAHILRLQAHCHRLRQRPHGPRRFN